MKFYKYWVRENQEVETDGRVLALQILGRSNESLERARHHAQERLANIRKRLRRGESLNRGYSYGERMQCEELIEEVPGANDSTLAAISRNRYNSLVLNTSDIVFADVDFVPLTLGQKLRRVFGKGKTPRDIQLDKIREYHRNNGGLVLRIYATRAGLRILVLNLRAKPDDKRVQEFFRAVECDPVYIRLCRAQQSFRARLTPKYWRCSVGPAPNGYPWTNAVDKKHYTDWLAKYDEACQQYSVCEFVETLGTVRIDRELQKIIDLHDRYTIRRDVKQLA